MKPFQVKERTIQPKDVKVEEGALAVDPKGRVWAAGDQQISCWDGKTVTAFGFKESLSITAVAAAGDRVYFATNWGLLVKSGDGWKLYTTETSDILDDHVTDLAVDGKGRAYVMFYSEGDADRPISMFDGERFTTLTAKKDFPAGHETCCIAFDAKNRLILGTDAGVVDGDGKKRTTPGSMKEVSLLVSDKEGVWAATWEGVYRFTGGKVTSSIKTPGGAKSVVVDGDTIWIAMESDGLLRVRGKTRKHFEDNFDSKDVQGLALGKDGTLWIAAEDALYQCRGDELTYFNGKAKSAKPAPPPKKRKLTPWPKKPLVAKNKLAAHVVKAIESAKLGAIPRDALFNLVRPAIGLVLGKGAASVGGSKLGGRPDLAPNAKWPTYSSTRNPRSMPFFAQIDLAAIAKYDIEGLLPKKGRLSFFIDTRPDEIQDARVLFDDGTKKPAPLAWPKDLVDRKSESNFVAQLPESALDFYATWTLPSAEYLTQHVDLTDADRSALDELEKQLHAKDPKKSSSTRLLGWPNSLQGEIVSTPESIILLQIDADMSGPKRLEQLFSYWGNGIAHYLIHRSDLAKKKVSEASAELAYT